MITTLSKFYIDESNVRDPKELVKTLNLILRYCDDRFARVELSKPAYYAISSSQDIALDGTSNLNLLCLNCTATSTVTLVDNSCAVYSVLKVAISLAHSFTLDIILDSLSIHLDHVHGTSIELTLFKDTTGWTLLSTLQT